MVGSLCVKSGTGACSGNTAGTISAADLAEHMPVADPSLQIGDIVVMSEQPGASLQLTKSTHAAQSNVAGVVSTKPGVALGAETSFSRPIALAGRVPVNVTLEGGPIRIGDYLKPSSTPGKAMRAADAADDGIIGIALKPFRCRSVTSEVALTSMAKLAPSTKSTSNCEVERQYCNVRFCLV